MGLKASPLQDDSTKVDTTLNMRELTVTSTVRRINEIAMVSVAKNASVVMSTVSAQEIKRAQDANASEVIRRVPGVSLIDDKFVMVRGLSQRYNNVWINGGGVPSSEADARAFSFDIIPSGQIDNLMIIKTPAPEYPADYTGGFILINTKDVPSSNSLSFTAGGNWNTTTAFRRFVTKNNSDWLTSSGSPWGDLRLGAEFTLRGRQGGMVGAVNFSDERRTLSDMANNLYGIYDLSNDRSNYLRRSTDNQYSHNRRLGALLNGTWLSASGKHKWQWKNILNLIHTSRYTWRTGISAQSNREASAEYFTRSRLTYNTQFTGRHTLGADVLEWSASYSYANRLMPNRRRYLVDDALTDDGTLGLTSANDINIEHTRLHEHIVSLSVGDTRSFNLGRFTPQVKVGAYGEYRTRRYRTREELYNWDPSHNTLPRDFRQMNLPELLSDPQYQGPEGLYLIEDPHWRNSYDGHNTLGSAYASLTFPIGKASIYGGLRYEYSRMELVSNTRDYEASPSSRFYNDGHLYPSLNASYKFNDRHQLRAAYGQSVNRAEFREVSSSVYYDFDLASSVQGNAGLRTCHVNNLDLRYEWYPSAGETVSLAAFYKHFADPIEWTYTVAGGTDLIYSFENARSAYSYGLELDVRKRLDFLGLKGFSWSFNGALIKSRVQFEASSRNEARPMQGQSPYLVNTGLFYTHQRLRLTAAVLYNRIGKRIIGVGRSEGTTGSDEAARIPDSYEMPRDAVDFSISKSIGSRLEIKANVRDILSQSVTYQQFATSASGGEVKQVTRKYKPGRNIAVSLTLKL